MGNSYKLDRLRLHEIGLLLVVLVVGESLGQNLSWWQTSIVYQLYPRSFKDSNGDGIGDIKGIISKLDYFTECGIDSFWLSPVYASPMRDFGYDISDFRDIAPIFGTLQDFDMLVDETHKRGMYIIMDLVPGHTSTDHAWFNKSVNREGNYSTYYVWDDGIDTGNGTRGPPNNWLSVFGGPAWSWNSIRNQFYYHAFLPEQADLNYRDPNVQWEMQQVVRFWLDKGVDGYRVDAIEKLYENPNVSLNEPVSGQNVTSFQYEYLNHIYTSNQPENIAEVSSWYNILREYYQKDGKERYMVIELYASPNVRNQLYETGGSPFNFDLIDLSLNPTGNEIRGKVLDEYNSLPDGKWPNFVLGNHDRRRVSHKFGYLYVGAYNLLLLTLWGTPTTYYGEEIGMLEGIISWNETVDPWGRNYGMDRYQEFSRDPERTPMQWTGGYQAGFTDGSTTWLPLGQNYTTINVGTERMSSGMTNLKLYSLLARLRKRAAFQSRNFAIAYVNNNIFSFVREGGGEKYLVAINVGQMNVTVNFTPWSPGSSTGIVVAFTPGIQNMTLNSTLNLSIVNLSPGDGLLIQIIDGQPATAKPGSAHGLRPGMLPHFISAITYIVQPLFVWAILRYNNIFT